MILCESCCLLAETPFSDCTKASSPLAFYSTVGSSFLWKKKKQKEEKRSAASRTAGSGCIFFAPVAGWFSMAIIEPKRTSKVLLLWSCRLAYPMPLTGGHLFECLALLHNGGTRRAFRTSSSSEEEEEEEQEISSDQIHWFLQQIWASLERPQIRFFAISRSCCESSNPEMTTRVQRSRISSWSSCTLSFAFATHAQRFSLCMYQG